MKTAELLTGRPLSARHHTWAKRPTPCLRRHKGDRSQGCVASGRQLLSVEPRRGASRSTHSDRRSTPCGRALHVATNSMVTHGFLLNLKNGYLSYPQMVMGVKKAQFKFTNKPRLRVLTYTFVRHF